MSNTMLRRFKIIEMIPDYPRKITTRELVSKLGCDGLEYSIRTIQRDLEFLSSCGMFAISCDSSSKPAGWYKISI